MLIIHLRILLNDVCEIINTTSAILFCIKIPKERKLKKILNDYSENSNKIENIFKYVKEDILDDEIKSKLAQVIKEKNKKISSYDYSKLCLVTKFRDKIIHGHFEILTFDKDSRIILKKDFIEDLMSESTSYYSELKGGIDKCDFREKFNAIMNENIESIVDNILNWLNEWSKSIIKN